MTGGCVWHAYVILSAHYTVYCSLLPRGDDERGTVIVLISMVRFIFAVIMQVYIPICDNVDIFYDYYDVHHHIYTVQNI